MSTVLSFIAELLSTPAAILGLVAGVGLMALKKSPSEVVTGVLKTMFGFLILLAGASVIVSALTPFGTMFATAFGLNRVIAEDNSVVATVQNVLGRETALILTLAFMINVLIVRHPGIVVRYTRFDHRRHPDEGRWSPLRRAMDPVMRQGGARPSKRQEPYSET